MYAEIAGPDAEALRSFYSSIFGWGASFGGVPGGFRQDPAETLVYVGVPDINEALRAIEERGGRTVMPRTVVPGVVTFAMFTDPAGNRMGLAEQAG